MSIAKLSIKRPVFITSVIILILLVGVLGFKKMAVDLLPETSLPMVVVQTVYPGAGPKEVESMVVRPLEDEISSLAGIKSLVSRSLEGQGLVTVEFQSDIDAKNAEQMVRDKVNIVKPLFPSEVKEPIVNKIDLSASPIMTVAISSEVLSSNQLYEIGDKYVKPRFEQVKSVGSVQVLGGKKREIQVILDQKKLKDREISVIQVASQIQASGENIPTGKINRGEKEIVYRGLGEFQNVSDISDILVNLHGNEIPTRVSDLGIIVDTFEDEKSRAFLDGKSIVILQVFRQSGTNTLKVSTDIKKQIAKLQKDMYEMKGAPKLTVLVDTSNYIKSSVSDVYETIVISIILTIITVFFFLGSLRSTIIAAISLPVSLIGAFAIMSLAGFSINIITLLALTLAVGLLVDDAIVVIENIHTRMESGEKSKSAAINAISEIQLAVIAITLVVVAVFVPVGLMSGIIGQFFKEFGFSVAFAMLISLFVALTLIPMLSAYFSGPSEKQNSNTFWDKTGGRLLRGFNRIQAIAEVGYEKLLRLSLKYSKTTVSIIIVIFLLSLGVATRVSTQFSGVEDNGESAITLELPSGASIDATSAMLRQVESIVKKHDEVEFVMSTIGGSVPEMNKALLFVKQKKKRIHTTLEFRDLLREELSFLKDQANPVVKNYDSAGLATQPIVIDLTSTDADLLAVAAKKVFQKMKAMPALKDVDTTLKMGKEEIQYKLNPKAAKEFGINTSTMGGELRAQVEGLTPAKFREKGREYDVRVRLQDDQRDLLRRVVPIYIPNINNNLVKLSNVATSEKILGLTSIEKKNRSNHVQITANTIPDASLGDVVSEIKKIMEDGDAKLPNDIRYQMGGDAESFDEMASSAIVAIILGILFIYLILSSLYESFITPLAIMISFPLALSGAFYGLFLTGKAMDIYAMLGLFMLIGVAGKNGILLVDFAKKLIDGGMNQTEALIQAGKARLRPILMTSFALIAGTIPIAIGFNEASQTRTSMGVVVIAGIFIATILTLIAVPAIFSYVERFRRYLGQIGKRYITEDQDGV